MKDQPVDYRASERSQEAKRTHLYHFNYEGTHFFYTSFDSDIVVNGGPIAKMADPQTFLSAQIAHSKPSESLESNPATVTISLAANDSALKKYLLNISPRMIDVEIWRVSSLSLPGPLAYDDDMRMIFRGIIDSIGFESFGISAVCITRMMREDMPIPRFFYQKMCNHMLYDQTPGACGVNPELYKVSLTVDTINRASGYIEFNSLTTVNVDSPARSITITQETFHGGTVEWEDEDGIVNEMGVIVCEPLTGPTRVRLWLAWLPTRFATLQAVTPQSVILHLGCIRIKRVCHSLFANLPNFGGTPYIPISNPAIDGVV